MRSLRRLLLFDIDGTLIDSGGAGIQSLKDVLREKFGISDDLHGVEVAGRTDTGIVHQILRKQNMAGNDETIAAFLDLYVKFLARELPRAREAFSRASKNYCSDCKRGRRMCLAFSPAI